MYFIVPAALAIFRAHEPNDELPNDVVRVIPGDMRSPLYTYTAFIIFFFLISIKTSHMKNTNTQQITYIRNNNTRRYEIAVIYIYCVYHIFLFNINKNKSYEEYQHYQSLFQFSSLSSKIMSVIIIFILSSLFLSL